MKVIRVSIPGVNENGYILSKDEIKNIIGEIHSLLEDGKIGDTLMITVIEIDKSNFDALSEFAGW